MSFKLIDKRRLTKKQRQEIANVQGTLIGIVFASIAISIPVLFVGIMIYNALYPIPHRPVNRSSIIQAQYFDAGIETDSSVSIVNPDAGQRHHHHNKNIQHHHHSLPIHETHNHNHGSVHVNGYYRSNGTYVHGYTRSR
jgi:hypothetical protein